MAVREQVANHTYHQPVRLAQDGRQTNIPHRSSRQSVAPQYQVGQRTYTQRQRPSVQPQTPADVYDEEEDDEDMYPQRSRSSVVVRNRPSYPSPVRQPDTEPDIAEGRKQKNPLFYAGLLLCVMLLGWLLFSILGSWIHTKLDDFTYGYPRTYQVDQDVGHYGRVSHFICVNLQGEIEVIETQKGHPEVAKIYVVIVLPQDQASVPVTISFQNIKGFGSIDAIVHFGSTEIPLYNNGTTFQTIPPAPK